MSLSTALSNYADIDQHLHTILQFDVRQRVFTNPAAALRWRARVNMYRKLVREAEGSSLFDHYVFQISAADPCTVTILTQINDGGIFLDADGNHIEPTATPRDHQLLEEAREAARKLKLVDDDDDEPGFAPPDISTQSAADLGIELPGPIEPTSPEPSEFPDDRLYVPKVKWPDTNT